MIIDKNNYKEFLSNDGKILRCSNYGVTELRYLPEGIEKLHCHNNKLISLPELPDSLRRLYCHNNNLPIQGIYYNKKQIKDYQSRLNQYILINQILEKI